MLTRHNVKQLEYEDIEALTYIWVDDRQLRRRLQYCVGGAHETYANKFLRNYHISNTILVSRIWLK